MTDTAPETETTPKETPEEKSPGDGRSWHERLSDLQDSITQGEPVEETPAAADEAKPEEKVPPAETKTDEEDDHKERSEVGRKYKKLEERFEEQETRFAEFQEKSAKLVEELEAKLAKYETREEAPPAAAEEDSDDDEPEFLTKKEWKAREAKIKAEAVEAAKKSIKDDEMGQVRANEEYKAQYTEAFFEEARELQDDQAFAQMIADEVAKTIIKPSGKGADVDARLEYNRTRGRLLAAQGAKKKPPLKEDSPDGPLGAGPKSDNAAPRTKPAVQLSKEAAGLAKHYGFNPERASEIVGQG